MIIREAIQLAQYRDQPFWALDPNHLFDELAKLLADVEKALGKNDG